MAEQRDTKGMRPLIRERDKRCGVCVVASIVTDNNSQDAKEYKWRGQTLSETPHKVLAHSQWSQ